MRYMRELHFLKFKNLKLKLLQVIVYQSFILKQFYISFNKHLIAKIDSKWDSKYFANKL